MDKDIKINISVKLSDDTKEFLMSLFGKSDVTKVEVLESEPKSAQKSAPKPVSVPETDTSEKSSITISMVRELLSDKVKEHRSEIKERLNELGAPSVTKLSPDKYKDLYEFLLELK
jgi:hypothetical protein